MPIRPENKIRYPADWTQISHHIRFERAGGFCECAGECGRHPGCHLAYDQDLRRANAARTRLARRTAGMDPLFEIPQAEHPEHPRSIQPIPGR